MSSSSSDFVDCSDFDRKLIVFGLKKQGNVKDTKRELKQLFEKQFGVIENIFIPEILANGSISIAGYAYITFDSPPCIVEAVVLNGYKAQKPTYCRKQITIKCKSYADLYRIGDSGMNAMRMQQIGKEGRLIFTTYSEEVANIWCKVEKINEEVYVEIRIDDIISASVSPISSEGVISNVGRYKKRSLLCRLLIKRTFK